MGNKSIYEMIVENLKEDKETLKKEFRLPSEDNKGISFAEGAMDGISIYHMGMPQIGDEDIAVIGNAITIAGSGDFEKADAAFKDFCNKYRVVCIIDEIQRYIIDHTRELNAGVIFRYAVHLVLESADVESVKAGIVILELFHLDEDVKKIIRMLALSDEFTLYAVFLMRNWENGQIEVLNAAKKVSGWGRIHAVHFIEPENDEIKSWLLKEGVHNWVVPAYSGLDCFEKADVARLLDNDKLSYEELHSILEIVDAILDEGPVQGISAIENPKAILGKVLRHAESMLPLEPKDYEVISKISDWQEKAGEDL